MSLHRIDHVLLSSGSLLRIFCFVVGYVHSFGRAHLGGFSDRNFGLELGSENETASDFARFSKLIRIVTPRLELLPYSDFELSWTDSGLAIGRETQKFALWENQIEVRCSESHREPTLFLTMVAARTHAYPGFEIWLLFHPPMSVTRTFGPVMFLRLANVGPMRLLARRGNFWKHSRSECSSIRPDSFVVNFVDELIFVKLEKPGT